MEVIREWPKGIERLSADEVRLLPAGSNVTVHRLYGRRGEYVCCNATVVQCGRKKMLQMRDYRGMATTQDIKNTARVAYTAVTD